jgi:tyrosinase
MSSSTRRTFVKGAAAIPFALWFEQFAWAQGSPKIRFDAASVNGKAMLKIYAAAVKKMRTTASFAEGNPRSWTFQWYTHQVKGQIQNNVANKANEIARIYPAPSAWKNLATEMWNTCQSHLGQPEVHFLPWHRMYVFFFESIIREVSGNASFTLPYWNYSIPKPNPLHGVIPPEFRMSGNATFDPLFVSKRNTGVNTGTPIDNGAPAGYLSTIALSECRYEPTSNTIQGFNQALDFGLHGNVHVGTGNSQNMGSVPWAAFDPIFYLHHCNIDRLWASWNAAGRKNPTTASFLNKTFVFADGKGNRVVATIKNFLDIAPLNYKYDRLEPVPACPPTVTPAAATARKHVATKPIALGTGPVHATLSAAPSPAATVTLGTRIQNLPANHRLYLVLRDLQTDVQPGVVYHLYLEMPAATTGGATTQYYVGTINFFHAEHHDHGDAPKFQSFDITDLAKSLHAHGKLASKAELTIVPNGQPATAAKPVIGEVSIAEI